MDHDQRFKVLLTEFFPEFIDVFFPSWVGRFDFSNLEWLQQEVFPDPPQGERFAVDLVAKVRLRKPVVVSTVHPQEQWLALVHVEVESRDTVQPVRKRIYQYRDYLADKHNLPVLAIGLYLRVGLDGIGWDVYEEYFWEHRLLRFEYPYVGLPALDAEHYLRQDNVLGIALTALMRVSSERRLPLGVEAWKRLVQSPQNVYRRHLLCECVSSYLPVDEAERERFEGLLLSQPEPGVQAMSRTLFEELQHRGQLQGQRRLLQLQLEKQFGPLPLRAQEHLQSLPEERLTEIALGLFTAKSLRELGFPE